MTSLPERSYSHVDKSGWGDGPWQDEPDKLQWIDSTTGLDCLIVRASSHGGFCGYVGVPPGHRFHGVRYDEVDVDIHGGLTYADRCQEDAPEEAGVCHVPAPGRPGDVWWLGFDCSHCMDLCPRYNEYEPAHRNYRDLAWVRREVERLAEQLA